MNTATSRKKPTRKSRRLSEAVQTFYDAEEALSKAKSDLYDAKSSMFEWIVGEKRWDLLSVNRRAVAKMDLEKVYD